MDMDKVRNPIRQVVQPRSAIAQVDHGSFERQVKAIPIKPESPHTTKANDNVELA